MSIKLAEYFPEIASVANLLFFSLSAMSLLFLSLGLSFPVTHHITIIAGLGALTFLPIVGGNAIVATIIGAVFGTLSAWWASCSPGSGTTTATPTSTRRRRPSGR